MFQWVKNILGGSELARANARLAESRAALLDVHAAAIKARYDNSLFTDDNQRNWWMADFLSAKSANNFQVRRQLRMRSRYEVSNNPYLFGVCDGNADDLVSTGPTLQVTTKDKGYNRAVEQCWAEWCAEVGFVEKVRTVKLAKTIDGEGFLILKTVRDLEHPVKLYPVDVEADQVTAVAPSNLQELWVDGLVLHPVTGRPVAYHVLKSHPGDYFFPGMNPLEVEKLSARFVVHWFHKFRPGQVRGVPVFTPSLDLFAELRAFRKAVLASAQIAANFSAVLESEMPAGLDGDYQGTSAFKSVPIDRGMMTALPSGMKLSQFDPKQPTTTYEMFQEKCLGEAVRPLRYPLNLALGTSQKFNFSSAKLDHINYRDGLTVERSECSTDVLDRLFGPWHEEAVLAGAVPVRSDPPPHEWHWPGFEPLDTMVDAQADASRIAAGQLTLRKFWAQRGEDWRDVLAQLADEMKEVERLGLTFGDVVKRTISQNTTDENVIEENKEQAKSAGAFDVA